MKNNTFTVAGGSITGGIFTAESAISPNFNDFSILLPFGANLGQDLNGNSSIIVTEQVSGPVNFSSLNNNVNSVPFEFNENLGVLTFLSIVGIGKGIEKWKKRKNKDSDSAEK